MNILAYFDVENLEHLAAFHYYILEGRWPDSFIEKAGEIDYVEGWKDALCYRITKQYLTSTVPISICITESLDIPTIKLLKRILQTNISTAINNFMKISKIAVNNVEVNLLKMYDAKTGSRQVRVSDIKIDLDI